MRLLRVLCFVVPGIFLVSISSASGSTIFFQGFETDNAGWNVNPGQYTAARVPSGTDGVPSATGGFHGEAGQYDLDIDGGSAFTRWGGYSSIFPTGGYTTSLDIYLDFDDSLANDTRFDWVSAVNNAAGTFLIDFDFNCGFYNDSDSTGAGNRYVCNAGNNAGRGGSFPKNSGSFSITTEGWYTFQHTFFDNGGYLAATLSILGPSSIPLHSWLVTTPIPMSLVGGNRYGWVASNEFEFLAIDNSQLRTADAVPEPATLTLLGSGIAAFLGARRRRRYPHS